MFQTKVVQKIKIHILYSVTFPDNRAVYEVIWKNMIKPQSTDNNVIRRMRFARWITMARICNTYCFSTATVVTRTLLSVMCYVHCLSCYSAELLNSVETRLEGHSSINVLRQF